jgi:hypothetical protein
VSLFVLLPRERWNAMIGRYTVTTEATQKLFEYMTLLEKTTYLAVKKEGSHASTSWRFHLFLPREEV